MTQHSLSGSSLVLVGGFWLGAWAWRDVAARLEHLGRRAQALTLPGLQTDQDDRSGITFADHTRHILKAISAAEVPAVLVAHSGAGAVATAVADRAPHLLKRIVYVDSGPVADGTVMVPNLPADQPDLPFPGLDALAADGASTEGISVADRARFAKLAVPHPARVVREPIMLGNPRRNEVPVTVVCCQFDSQTVQAQTDDGAPMFAPLADVADVRLVDLPTGHWPMFSRPTDLADILDEEARRD